jgi:hypothetical protein
MIQRLLPAMLKRLKRPFHTLVADRGYDARYLREMLKGKKNL